MNAIEKEKVALSIIIPMYNSEMYIGNAIRSVLEQEPHGIDFEIIVVDDASTDASSTVVESIPFHKLRLIRQEQNLGTAAARNTGIREAGGTWLQFLDSDDRLSENYLQSLEMAFKKGVDCIISSMVIEREDRYIRREIVRMEDKRALGYFYSVCNLTIRKQVMIEFNPAFSFEDVVFVFEMMSKKDLRTLLLKDVFYIYNQTNTESKLTNFNTSEYRKMFFHLFAHVKASDPLTKMFFLETFLGILFWNVIPLSLRCRIAVLTLAGFFTHLPSVMFSGVRGHIRNTVTLKNT